MCDGGRVGADVVRMCDDLGMAEPTQHEDLSAEFHATTGWGDAVITVRGPFVTRLRPPVPTSDRRVQALPDAGSHAAPVRVRALAADLSSLLDGDPVQLATPGEVAAWLAAAGVRGFALDVSMALFDVPRGVTIAYGELAALAGRPGAARAVGTACARNPLPILVPCHRVVHAAARHGDVGSYGAATGSAYKRRLLELEDAPLVCR